MDFVSITLMWERKREREGGGGEGEEWFCGFLLNSER